MERGKKPKTIWDNQYTQDTKKEIKNLPSSCGDGWVKADGGDIWGETNEYPGCFFQDFKVDL